MKLKTISIIAVLFFVPLLLKAQEKLAPGLYHISGEQGIKLKLNDTGKYYNITPAPVTTTAHIVSTTIKMETINNTHPILNIVFDDAGTKSIDKAFGDTFGMHQIQIGLILNNKLTNVITVMDYLKGPSISLALGDKYPLRQLEELKAKIDNSH